MKQLTTEEHEVVQRIKVKWTDTCNGLLHFTGSMRPLLMLEFQGYLDYLKVIEKQISFWEMKALEVNHQVGPCNLNNRIIMLKAASHLDIYLPGKIERIPIRLIYSSEDKKRKSKGRWGAVIRNIKTKDDS